MAIMDDNLNKTVEKINDELKNILEEMKAPNIAIIGKTGTGKSTLINKVFGVEKAETNAGWPVTQSFKLYTPDHSSVDTRKPINLYDSAGYEANKEQEFKENLFNFLNTKQSEGLPSQIHLIWYVINAASKRFEDFDADIINEINRLKIPVIIVLSQCDIVSNEDINKLANVIKECNFEKAYYILDVAAKPLNSNNKNIEPFGLKELVDKTLELLPTIYSDAIIANQIVKIGDKKKVAWKYIAAAATTCFVSGLVPIPLSAVIAMISSQVNLLKEIAKLYNSDKIIKIIDPITGQTGTTVLTIAAVGTLNISASFLVGLFPPGYLAVEAAAGAVAATYVVIMGLTFTSVCDKFSKRHFGGSESNQEVKDFIEQTFREEFNKYRKIRVTSPKSLEQIKDDFLSNRLQNINTQEIMEILNEKQDYDKLLRELVDAHDDIIGAVIISNEALPDTDYIGELSEDEIIEIAEKIITVASLKKPERIWVEYQDFDLIVVFNAKDCLLLVKANKTNRLGSLRKTIKNTSEKIQSLVDPNPASGNGYQPSVRQTDNEMIYRNKPESPES
ncbi:GTPase family protein [Moorena bouillonii]|uniref:G domain-containing protein n=1 Tax=Moorena bouillonii PNG TaxID=568701 RepID=A0A1U7N4R6_9CYAN|nr:GTPase domain-containing protein [Moorena bouillonii]OLT60932.1 hypothetical protein BJP37_19860 [Moorena bouillonii PNG]